MPVTMWTSTFSSTSSPLPDLRLIVLAVGLAPINHPRPENSLSGFTFETCIPRRSTSPQRIMVFDAPVSSRRGSLALMFNWRRRIAAATNGAGGR